MTVDRSEILFEVQEAIRRLQGQGRPIDEIALAQEFAVSVAEVEQCRAALALLEPSLPPPRLPEDYELLGELGRGGMGVVYRARQRSLDREVAVKVLRAGDVGGGNFIERFRKEARSLARLRHPHIVAIHEVGESDGCLFYSMDLIAGASLAELIARGEVTPARAVRVLRQVASAIAYSHSHGVIHRDLKPANILVDAAGEAFVADFGLARDLAARTDLTVSGQILGTPAYMSPEQARGDAARIGERSDVYALGAILYECLTGRAPFAGLGLAEMVYAVVHEEPKRPRRTNPLAPRELEVICGKAMAKRPEDRYATANALLEDLERFHEGRPLLARPPTVRYRVGRLLARQRRALLVGGVLAAVVLGVFFGVVLPRLRPPAAATVASARELLSAGEPAAALVLAEKAATQAGHERAHAAIASTTLAALLALVRDLPTRLDATGLSTGLAHLQRARDLAVASEDDADRDAMVATAWAFAGKAAQVPAFEAVDAIGQAVERVLAARRFEQEPSLHALLAFTVGMPSAGRDLLRLLEPSLLAPGDPLRIVAARIVSNLLAADPRGEVALEFDFRVSSEPKLVVPFFELLDRLEPTAAAKVTALFVKARELGPLARVVLPANDALSALAREGAGRAQATAAELLAVAADLPLRMPREGEDLVAPDAGRAVAIASLAAEVAPMPRLAGYRQRIAAAVASLDATAAEELTFLTAWLAEHTQAKPTHAAAPDLQVDAWRQWWSAHQGDDPRAWFLPALGLERIPDAHEAPALLARYLRAPHAERAAWHFLLSLVATPRAGHAVPRRPWPGDEPADLPMAWHRVFTAPDDGPRYCVRVACLRWLDGEASPTIAFEERRALRVGDQVHVSRRGELPVAPVSCESPRVPGVQPPGGVALGTWRVEIEPLRLIWTRRGRVQLIGDLRDASWGAMHPHVGSSSHSNGMPNVEEGAVAVLLRHELPAWAGGGVGGEQIVCATFEVCDGEPQAWTLADWRGVLVRMLEGLAPDSWVVPTGGLDWDRLYRAQRATELANWLPLPEAVTDLARLTVDVPFHQQRGSDGFSRNVMRARLLLGDAKALDASDFDARVPTVEADDMDAAGDTRFWARVWHASTNVGLRELAAARMQPARLPAATAAAMAASEPAALRTLPPALAGIVAEGGAAHWRARFLPDLGLLSAGLVTALVALAGVLAFLRARRSRTAGILLLVAGLLVATFDVLVDGRNLLPDAVGAVLAAVGSGLLAPGGRGFLRWLPVGFFAAAALLGGLDAAGVASFATSPAMTVAFAFAVLGLPGLAYAFPPRSPRAGWVSAVLTLAVLGAFGVRAGLVLYNDIGARIVFGMPGRLVLGGPSWAGLQAEWLPLLGIFAALVLVRWRARTP